MAMDINWGSQFAPRNPLYWRFVRRKHDGTDIPYAVKLRQMLQSLSYNELKQWAADIEWFAHRAGHWQLRPVAKIARSEFRRRQLLASGHLEPDKGKRPSQWNLKAQQNNSPD